MALALGKAPMASRDQFRTLRVTPCRPSAAAEVLGSGRSARVSARDHGPFMLSVPSEQLPFQGARSGGSGGVGVGLGVDPKAPFETATDGAEGVRFNEAVPRGPKSPFPEGGMLAARPEAAYNPCRRNPHGSAAGQGATAGSGSPSVHTTWRGRPSRGMPVRHRTARSWATQFQSCRTVQSCRTGMSDAQAHRLRGHCRSRSPAE